MKITLIKDLELYGVRYLSGTEVDVEPDVYEIINKHIIAERILERAQFEKMVADLDKTSISVEKNKRGRK